ncbi:hypothetical protein [Bacillus cereus]|uniref:hypothetical protein n=1 Tax=Bacillus cereus TaxID=1396 RepID=UPI002406044D|nr:hypothetical protein [Bacillus cereus]
MSIDGIITGPSLTFQTCKVVPADKLLIIPLTTPPPMVLIPIDASKLGFPLITNEKAIGDVVSAILFSFHYYIIGTVLIF